MRGDASAFRGTVVGFLIINALWAANHQIWSMLGLVFLRSYQERSPHAPLILTSSVLRYQQEHLLAVRFRFKSAIS